jgi:hypothetical protein
MEIVYSSSSQYFYFNFIDQLSVTLQQNSLQESSVINVKSRVNMSSLVIKVAILMYVCKLCIITLN